MQENIMYPIEVWTNYLKISPSAVIEAGRRGISLLQIMIIRM
jgi:hypothetical protein